MALLGPRQCGKTTLAREVAQIQNAEYFDLEDPTDLARLTAPKLTLEQLGGLVIIDEFQQRPDLLPLLRVLLDRQPAAGAVFAAWERLTRHSARRVGVARRADRVRAHVGFRPLGGWPRCA